jgi:hypothetical protein
MDRAEVGHVKLAAQRRLSEFGYTHKRNSRDDEFQLRDVSEAWNVAKYFMFVVKVGVVQYPSHGLESAHRSNRRAELLEGNFAFYVTLGESNHFWPWRNTLCQRCSKRGIDDLATMFFEAEHRFGRHGLDLGRHEILLQRFYALCNMLRQFFGTSEGFSSGFGSAGFASSFGFSDFTAAMPNGSCKLGL